jgi:hypothetical protein
MNKLNKMSLEEIKSKKSVLLQKRIEESGLSHINDTNTKYIIIDFTSVMWCSFDPLECIFGDGDTFEDFNIQLIQHLKIHFKEAEAITDIAYALHPLVKTNTPPEKYTYKEKIYDKVIDGDRLYISWIKRNNWKAVMLGLAFTKK